MGIDYHDKLGNLDRDDLNKDGKLDVLDLAVFKISASKTKGGIAKTPA